MHLERKIKPTLAGKREYANEVASQSPALCFSWFSSPFTRATSFAEGTRVRATNYIAGDGKD